MAMFMGATDGVITHFDFKPKKKRGRHYSISGRLTSMANQWGLSLYGKCYIYI